MLNLPSNARAFGNIFNQNNIKYWNRDIGKTMG